MSNRIVEMFGDAKLVNKIKRRLPYLFQIADIENSRAGRTGMEVGSARERIIIALLIYKFGESSVDTEIPITEPEVDVKLFGNPISIKTVTSKSLSGVKLKWTVDSEKSEEFLYSYSPTCDIIFVQINWGGSGGFYYIPLEVQRIILDKIGGDNYIKLPKAGTNPRGIEIQKKALVSLMEDEKSEKIIINWQKSDIKFNAYKRWIDMWKED
jgi:hypothetical protein